MTLSMMVLSIFLGCDDPGETARGGIVRAPSKLVFKQSQNALKEAGIHSLVWGATPFVTRSVDVAEQYQPMVSIVAELLGTPMSVRVGDDYEHVETMLLNGEIDIALMSPYAYVQAKAKEPGLKVFCSPIANGTETYGAYIVTREDSDVQSLLDLRGKPFGFVNSRSTSGWLYPASRMMDEGMDPTRDVQGVFFGDHAGVIKAIVSGKVAAGATYDGALASGRGQIEGARKLRVIARTQRIPYDAYVVRKDFPPKAIPGLQLALSSVSSRDARGRAALEPLIDINGFVRTDDTVYREIREIEERVQSLLRSSGGTLPTLFTEPEEPARDSEHSTAKPD
jgi:phosphate/phosphite/phosphonate ABC transporter binding protein